jgi:hypothetical protein
LQAPENRPELWLSVLLEMYMKINCWFNQNPLLSPLRIATAHRLSPLRCGFLFSALALASFALSPAAQASCLQGCDSSLSTFLGDEALGNRGGCELGCGVRNTAVGFNALLFDDTGSDNTATGAFALLNNGAGSFNTADGSSALRNNTTGLKNTATGANALFGNKTGSENTANGINALVSNTDGFDNTANGAFALSSNTIGGNNTATGASALFKNNGSNNTANGASALFNNIGDNNTANGVNALFKNTTGVNDTATGVQALAGNTTGNNNTATGNNALFSNKTGANNTANGIQALQSNTNGNFNTADGVSALLNNTSGKSNIALGASAGANLTTGSNNIDIGAPGVAGEAGKIRIGKVGTQTATFVAGIHGVTVASGVGVIVGSNGQLGTVTSSARFKEAIKPMDKASEAILALKPVTFRYKQELDPDGLPQFGLLAEQVEKVNSDLVARDADGNVNTVRYEAVNAMLLNEFLKEHRKVQELEKDLRATIAQQQKQIKALSATVQRVSNQIQLSKPAAQIVANE